jgi:hypothetical protein
MTSVLPTGSTVTITAVKLYYDDGTFEITRRRQLLRTVLGVEVSYSVVSSLPNASQLEALLSNPSSTTALTTSLATTFPDAKVQAPLVLTPTASPTNAPTLAPSASPTATPTMAPAYTFSPVQPKGQIPGAQALVILKVMTTLSGLAASDTTGVGFDKLKSNVIAQVYAACNLDKRTDNVTISSAVSFRRRSLLAGAALEISIQATMQNPTTLVSNLQSSTPAMQQQLRNIYPGISLTVPTLVPNPTPPSSASVAACFAGTEVVTLESGELKPISQVRIGDRIMSANKASGVLTFSDVVYVPHGKNHDRTMFSVITTDTGRDLTMTSNHVLLAGGCDSEQLHLIPVSGVNVGDCVQTVLGYERISSVRSVEGMGSYTVIAMEELLVVNGIIVTPFGGVNPTLANIYYNLHRVLYFTMRSNTLAGTTIQILTELLWGNLLLLSY